MESIYFIPFIYFIQLTEKVRFWKALMETEVNEFAWIHKHFWQNLETIPYLFHCVKSVQIRSFSGLFFLYWYWIRRFSGKTVHIWSFFWSLFSCIRTEYGDLIGKSPYSVRIQENVDQKKLRICIKILSQGFLFPWTRAELL